MIQQKVSKTARVSARHVSNFSSISQRSRLALASVLAGLTLFGAGMATTVLAQTAARTYSTKGKVTNAQGGKLVIKDKFGAEWEYTLPKGLETSVGKDVKVVYVMQAVKIEAP
jgi:hypothetical protein